MEIFLKDDTGERIVLEQVRRSGRPLPVLVITTHGNLRNAVAAKKLGVEAYLVAVPAPL